MEGQRLPELSPGSPLSGARSPQAPAARRLRTSFQARRRRLAWALLAPAVLVGALFTILPVLLTANISLRDVHVPILSELMSEPFTLTNYSEGLDGGTLGRPLLTTALFTVGVNVPAFALGLGLALLFARAFPGRRFLQVLCTLPWAVPGVAAASIFLWMFDGAYGVINFLLHSVGLIDEYVPWLAMPDTALIGVIVPTVWVQYPFFMLMMSASLAAVPRELYDAAKVDGAGGLRRFWSITWPGIRNTSLLALLLSVLTAIREFDLIFTLTGGGPIGATETLAVRIYNEYFDYFSSGVGAALSIVSVALSVALLLAAYPITRRQFF